MPLHIIPWLEGERADQATGLISTMSMNKVDAEIQARFSVAQLTAFSIEFLLWLDNEVLAPNNWKRRYESLILDKMTNDLLCGVSGARVARGPKRSRVSLIDAYANPEQPELLDWIRSANLDDGYVFPPYNASQLITPSHQPHNSTSTTPSHSLLLPDNSDSSDIPHSLHPSSPPDSLFLSSSDILEDVWQSRKAELESRKAPNLTQMIDKVGTNSQDDKALENINKHDDKALNQETTKNQENVSKSDVDAIYHELLQEQRERNEQAEQQKWDKAVQSIHSSVDPAIFSPMDLFPDIHLLRIKYRSLEDILLCTGIRWPTLSVLWDAVENIRIRSDVAEKFREEHKKRMEEQKLAFLNESQKEHVNTKPYENPYYDAIRNHKYSLRQQVGQKDDNQILGTIRPWVREELLILGLAQPMRENVISQLDPLYRRKPGRSAIVVWPTTMGIRLIELCELNDIEIPEQARFAARNGALTVGDAKIRHAASQIGELTEFNGSTRDEIIQFMKKHQNRT